MIILCQVLYSKDTVFEHYIGSWWQVKNAICVQYRFNGVRVHTHTHTPMFTHTVVSAE